MIEDRIKVLHLVEDLKTGGAERIIADISEGLNRQEFAAGVWCLTRGGEIADELKNKGIPVGILRISNYHNPLTILGLSHLLRKEKPDIVHTHLYFASVIGRLAARRAAIPILLSHVHSTYWEYKKRHIWMERFLSRITKKIICCSKAVEHFVTHQERIRSSKTIVIYNGVDEERFSSTKEPSLIKTQLGIDSESPVVGSVSSLKALKGHTYLLRAVPLITDIFPKTKFLIVGDGPLRPLLEAQVKEENISSSVIFTGTRQDIPDLLSAMDVFILPSCLREGLGIAIIEAMAAAKPVVATDIGGIPEVVRSGATGLLVPPRDEIALGEAIIQLLKNPEMSKHLGKQGKLRFKKRFTKKKMISEIENLYKALYDTQKEKK